MKTLLNVKLLGILILCLALTIPSAAFALDKYVGKITRVKGEVRLKSDKRVQAGKWLRVKKGGVRVFSGDEIRTLVGEAELTFNDGSVIKVKRNTHFMVEERSTKKSFFSFVSPGTINRNIKVFIGSLWAKITPKKGKWTSFESKSAVAGIRGTTVSLSVDSSGNMQFECDEGFTEVASPDGSVILKMDSGKEIKISKRPGGKSYIEVIKGEVDVKSGNIIMKMSQYAEVEVGTEDGKTSLHVAKGEVEVEVDGHIVEMDGGDAITYDSITGLAVTAGTVTVTKPDGTIQEMKKGTTLVTAQETKPTSKTDTKDSEGDDEQDEDDYDEDDYDEEDYDEDDALEVVKGRDPIPVEESPPSPIIP